MTGLDLESFLLMLRADLGGWALLVVGSLMLALLVWVSWGSRQAIRRCLALSVAAHVGLVLGGSNLPVVLRTFDPRASRAETREHIRRIKVSPVPLAAPSEFPEAGGESEAPARPSDPPRLAASTAIDRLDAPVQLEARRLAPSRPDLDVALPEPPDFDSIQPPSLPPIETTIPTSPPPPTAGEPEERPGPPSLALAAAAPDAPSDLAGDEELAPPEIPSPAVESAEPPAPAPGPTAILADSRLRSRPPRPAAPEVPPPSVGGSNDERTPVPLALATPRPTSRERSTPALADLAGPGASRRSALTEVPRIYRSRLDADRSARAERGGASAASEQAVERALDWLARHQDADGRWDGGTARYADGEVVEGDDDFTAHCPPGEVCFGECAYWEADTGLTGLALLTYLGAGYTHKEGKYAATITKGLNFLMSQQKPDGDLRGVSTTVGMYCHAMATLALCEAYALSLDDRLLNRAERAVGFLARSRAEDGQAWRYAPRAPIGDTSILGWVVMALKSAREVGIPIANQESLEKGSIEWLDRVSAGRYKGLARYQPWDEPTPTMTAEAWVCRQFLGIGGPGPSSSEAAAHLLEHESDRGETNVYYWYYATLAMYQHGGQPWRRWNDRLRDRLVNLQRKSGHQTGSWDPDDSVYGARGGRIYCTALAALSLEVYYRYLRLYDEPSLAEDEPEPADDDFSPPTLQGPTADDS